MYVENKITSVCVVKQEGENFITRIADVRGNELVKPDVDYDRREFKGFNRDNLYYNRHEEPNLREGHIGVWEWSVRPKSTEVDKEWVDSSYKNSTSPIEVIDRFRNKNKEEIIAILRNGVGLSHGNHLRMILFRNGYQNHGVLLSPNQLESIGGSLHVKEDIYTLPTYNINENELLNVAYNKSHKISYLFRFLQLPQSNGHLAIHSPAKAVKDMFVKRLNKRFVKDHGGTREEYRTFRRWIEALPEKDIIGDITECCHCSDSVAAEHWKKFSDNLERYLRCEDIETQVLRGLLDIDDGLRARVYEEWQTTSQLELKKEEAQFLERQAQLEAQRKLLGEEQERLEADFVEFQENHKAEISRLQSETQKAEACVIKAQQEVEHYKKLGRESLRLVRENLSLARDEAAEFLANLALFGVPGDAVSVSSPSVPAACFLPSVKPEERTDVEDAEALLDEFWDNLERAGVNPKRRRELAAFLYGAFMTNTPLLLAGPQGTLVADALSCAMTGRHAAVLDCCGKWDPSLVDRVLKEADDVVIVKHPFLNRWIDHLLPEICATDKLWIFIHPYADDLPLEPAGLYQYALPLVMDIFMLHSASGDMVCCQKGRGYRDFPSTRDVRSLLRPLRKLSRNCYLEAKVEQLMTSACSVKENGDEAFLLWGCLLFPLAVALGRKEIFLESIQKDTGLSQADRTFLEDIIGELR